MSYKMVAIDLDGTLLTDQNIITKKEELIIKELSKKGVMFILASGRPYQSILPYAKQLGLKFPLITTNGALVKYSNGDTIHQETLDYNHVNKLIRFGLRNDLGVVLYYKDKFETFSEKTAEVQQRLENIEVEVIKKFESFQNPLKIVYYDDKQNISKLLSEIQVLFKNLYITQSEKIYLEFMNKSVSKGAALKQVIENYGLKREEVIAIGNNHNDLSMFKEVGKAVAMGNSPLEVKEIADIVTDSNNNNGIFNILEKTFF